MNQVTEFTKPHILEDLTGNFLNTLELGKKQIERHLTAENFCNVIGGLAVVLTVDDTVKGNYLRAAGWAGFSMFHLRQRGPNIR